MFTSTMNEAELYKEAKKDFFELSTKIKIALERFGKRQCDMLNNSNYTINDIPSSLIKKRVEKMKWRTRRNNTWNTYFRFHFQLTGIAPTMEYFVYTPVYRTTGTEYLFIYNLSSPLIERFTLHFIERYKERCLVPKNIELGSTPAPLHFRLHNGEEDCFPGVYYKNSALDLEENGYKRFWIAPEGIYVTDYLDGMLTYITFMAKESLSPLKKQVYEEETVWHYARMLSDPQSSDEEKNKACYALINTPNLATVCERFGKRNLKDDEDGRKQQTLKFIRQTLKGIDASVKNAKEMRKQMDVELLRKNRITGSLNYGSMPEELDIKPYDLK